MASQDNLSHVQMNEMADTTKIGAMPIQNKYDGSAPIKTPSMQGAMQPNQNSITTPKPGFF